MAWMGSHGSPEAQEGILAPAIWPAESPHFDLFSLALSRNTEEFCKAFSTVKPKPLPLRSSVLTLASPGLGFDSLKRAPGEMSEVWHVLSRATG